MRRQSYTTLPPSGWHRRIPFSTRIELWHFANQSASLPLRPTVQPPSPLIQNQSRLSIGDSFVCSLLMLFRLHSEETNKFQDCQLQNILRFFHWCANILRNGFFFKVLLFLGSFLYLENGQRPKVCSLCPNLSLLVPGSSHGSK